METFTQVYGAPPGPTEAEIEGYRRTANRVGRGKAIEQLRKGRPGIAYLRIVETCEAEAKVLGFGGISLPAHDGMRRLAEAKRAEVAS